MLAQWPHRSLSLLCCKSAFCCLHLVPVGAGACHSQLCSLLYGSEEGTAGRGQKKAPACIMFATNQSQNSPSFRCGFCQFLSFHSTSLRSPS